MKNLFKKSVLLLLFLIANVVTANITFENVYLFSESSKSLNLQLSNNDGASEIFIKDSEGVLLYSELVKSSKLSKRFDLSLLPNGIYYIEVVGQTKINVIPFKVSKMNVEVLVESKSIVHKPIIRVNDNLVFISKFSPNKELLKITFYDTYDNLLFEEKLDKEITKGKIFDISQLPKGKYKLTAKYDDGRSVIKEIIK